MATKKNGLSFDEHTLTRLAFVVLFGVLWALHQLVVAPEIADARAKVAALEHRLGELAKALQDHEDKIGHAGVLAKLATTSAKLAGVSESVKANDSARRRELGHPWDEMREMRTCNNGRKP